MGQEESPRHGSHFGTVDKDRRDRLHGARSIARHYAKVLDVSWFRENTRKRQGVFFMKSIPGAYKKQEDIN